MAKHPAIPRKQKVNPKKQKIPAKPPRKRSVQEWLTAISDALTEELLDSLEEDSNIQEGGAP